MSEEIQTNDRLVFDLSGGSLCLDFTNTIDDRGTEVEQEHLTSYRNLVACFLRSIWRRALARLPQLFMLHQRRVWFLLVSINSHRQSSAAHILSIGSVSEVSRSAAERTAGHIM